jgi:hypothetical protein
MTIKFRVFYKTLTPHLSNFTLTRQFHPFTRTIPSGQFYHDVKLPARLPGL